MITKKGFTLIELVVVVALFGFLIIVASNFLIGILSGNNRVTTENEVRQNAALVMQDLTSEIRKAGCVYYYTSGGRLLINLSDEDAISMDVPTCTAANDCCTGGRAVQFENNNGVVTKVGQVVSSNKVAVCGNLSCTSAPCSSAGISLLGAANPTGGEVTVVLKVRQALGGRQDSCANLTLRETISPRNGSQ